MTLFLEDELYEQTLEWSTDQHDYDDQAYDYDEPDQDEWDGDDEQAYWDSVEYRTNLEY